jgi:hypothetical protein
MSALKLLLTKTGHWWPKSAISAAHSVGIASICTIDRSTLPFNAFHSKNHAFAFPEAMASILSCFPMKISEGSFDGKQSPWQLRDRPPPTPHLRHRLDQYPLVFDNLSPSQPSTAPVAVPQKAVHN